MIDTFGNHICYEETVSDELEQGDLLFRCPIVKAVESARAVELDQIDGVIEYADVIILTQSCDLQSKNSSGSYVVVCPHFDLEQARENNLSLASKSALNEILKGRRVRYHLLDSYDAKMGHRIVDFGAIHSLPFDFLTEFAKAQTPRVRLRSPYKEHLSQAFAKMFMRVGLPQNIQLPELN